MMLIDCSKVYDEIVGVVVQPWFGAPPLGEEMDYTLELRFEFSCDNVIWKKVKDGNVKIFKADFTIDNCDERKTLKIPTC
jgi:hypothetical protein